VKALGLALVAVLAMGAVVASAASAHTPADFTVEVATSTLKSEGTVSHVFKVTGVETFCEVSSDTVTPHTITVETLTVEPIYQECIAESIFGTINVTVTGFGPNECHFKLWANGKTDIVCPEGKEVTIDAATCTIHIPPQTGLGSNTFTTGNKVTVVRVKHDLTVHENLLEITTNHTDGFGCPLPSGGESATATYTGTWTVWAESPPGVLAHLTWDATDA
jgi:hypothetical protein